MKSISKRFLAVMAAISLCVTGCGGKEEPAKTEPAGTEEGKSATSGEPIKVGFEGWCAGADAYFGVVAQTVLEDYIAQVNEKGGWLGRPVELIGYDYSKDFSECVNVTNKLISQDKVVAIIGPDGDPFAIPTAPLAENAKIPMIAHGITTPQATLKEDGVTVTPYMFRTSPLGTEGAKALAKYIYDELGARRVATLTEKTNIQCVALTDVFREYFTSLGGEIVREEGYEVLATEFRAQLTNIAQADPEFIFMPAAAHKEVGNTAKQLSELGYGDKIKLLGYDACMMFPELLENAGKELEGAYLFSGADMSDPRFDAIKADYKEKHADLNMELHVWALYALDAIKVLENAILTTESTDGEKLREAIENTKGLEVTTGTFTNDSATHAPAGQGFNIYTIQNSEFVKMGTYSAE